MNNTLWPVISAKLQYDMQKNTRGAGIIGLAVFFLLFILWDDWLYPIFDALGFVQIAHNAGLVQDTSVGTFFAVAAVLIVLLVSTTIIMLLLRFPPIQLIVFLPFILIYMAVEPLIKKYKKPESINYYSKEDITEEEYFEHLAKEDLRKKYECLKKYPQQYSQGKLYFEQYNDSRYANKMKQLTREEAFERLHAAVSTLNSPQNYVVAYSPKFDGTWYILGPQPLPAYVSKVVDYQKDFSMKDVQQALNEYTEDAELYVPAQPIRFSWDGKDKFYHYKVEVDRYYNYRGQLNIPKDSDMMPLSNFAEFYFMNEGPFPSFYRSNTLLSVGDAIKRSHELAYLIPVYFENEWVKYATGQPNFMTAIEKTPNYETLGLVYMSEVEKKLHDLTVAGDIKALEAYRRMESKLQKD